MMEDARASRRITIRYRSYLAAVDVFHGGLAKQKVHVILRLEAADELRVVQPSKTKGVYAERGKQRDTYRDTR